jgi:hypothetical protein
MSYYGYPGVVINNVYYPRYRDPYYPQYSDGLTVIRKDQLQAPDVSRVSLERESIREIGRISLSKTPPSMRPEQATVQIEKLSENRVFLHKNENSKELKKFTPRAEDNIYKYPDIIREGDEIRRHSSYPSSPQITLKKLGKDLDKELKSKDSKSPVSRFFDYLSKESSISDKITRSIKSYKGPSSNKSSLKSNTPSRSKTSTMGSTRKSSSSKSSRKASSSSRKSKSTKTKKKK